MIEHIKPTLTILADAAVKPLIQRSGWGGWIKGNGRRSVTCCGSLPYSTNTSLAELSALLNALEYGFHTSYITEDVGIILQSDSVSALGVLAKNLPNSFVAKYRAGDSKVTPCSLRGSEDLLSKAHALTSRFKIVYLRHVRAHRNGINTRSYVNELCDSLASKAALK